MCQYVIVIGVLLLTLNISLYSQNGNSKANAIHDLLIITKVKEVTHIMVNRIFADYKNKRPDIPDSVWQNIKMQVRYENYFDRLVSIYDKSYTEAEIRDLIKFLQEGKKEKFNQMYSRIHDDSYKVGKTFGQEIVQLITLNINQYQ